MDGSQNRKMWSETSCVSCCLGEMKSFFPAFWPSYRSRHVFQEFFFSSLYPGSVPCFCSAGTSTASNKLLIRNVRKCHVWLRARALAGTPYCRSRVISMKRRIQLVWGSSIDDVNIILVKAPDLASGQNRNKMQVRFLQTFPKARRTDLAALTACSFSFWYWICEQ